MQNKQYIIEINKYEWRYTDLPKISQIRALNTNEIHVDDVKKPCWPYSIQHQVIQSSDCIPPLKLYINCNALCKNNHNRKPWTRIKSRSQRLHLFLLQAIMPLNQYQIFPWNLFRYVSFIIRLNHFPPIIHYVPDITTNASFARCTVYCTLLDTISL